ncbi:hypothetical protein SNEBB_005649 [Seison nebaliae]|nr:hypothetical protein SNEBB_005649 [Seison nebaliae]
MDPLTNIPVNSIVYLWPEYVDNESILFSCHVEALACWALMKVSGLNEEIMIKKLNNGFNLTFRSHPFVVIGKEKFYDFNNLASYLYANNLLYDNELSKMKLADCRILKQQIQLTIHEYINYVCWSSYLNYNEKMNRIINRLFFFPFNFVMRYWKYTNIFHVTHRPFWSSEKVDEIIQNKKNDMNISKHPFKNILINSRRTLNIISDILTDRKYSYLISNEPTSLDAYLFAHLHYLKQLKLKHCPLSDHLNQTCFTSIEYTNQMEQFLFEKQLKLFTERQDEIIRLEKKTNSSYFNWIMKKSDNIISDIICITIAVGGIVSFALVSGNLRLSFIK